MTGMVKGKGSPCDMDQEERGRASLRLRVWDPNLKGWGVGGDTLNLETGVPRCVYLPIRRISPLLGNRFRLLWKLFCRVGSFFGVICFFATSIFLGKVFYG